MRTFATVRLRDMVAATLLTAMLLGATDIARAATKQQRPAAEARTKADLAPGIA